MESSFHLDYVIDKELDLLIGANPELSVLKRIWEIEVDVDGKVEEENFDAHNQMGVLQTYSNGHSVSNIKVTWDMTDKDLSHSIQDILDNYDKNTKEKILSLIKSIKNSDDFDLELKKIQITDEDSQYCKNIHKVFYNKKEYDITSIIGSKQLESMESKLIENHLND